MADKRKPQIIFLLRFQGMKTKGKNIKIEIFPAGLFSEKDKVSWIGRGLRFRLRINGKWWKTKEGKTFFWKTEIRDMMWKSISWK